MKLLEDRSILIEMPVVNFMTDSGKYCEGKLKENPRLGLKENLKPVTDIRSM